MKKYQPITKKQDKDFTKTDVVLFILFIILLGAVAYVCK